MRRWAIGTLGSFCDFLVLAFLALEPVAATASLLLMFHLARSHPSPVGVAGGAPSAARAAARPAAVAAAIGFSAGASDSKCTGTLASSWTIADYGRWILPSAREMSLVPRRARRPPLRAPILPRRREARLPALLAAVADCFLAWAEASSRKGGGGGG